MGNCGIQIFEFGKCVYFNEKKEKKVKLYYNHHHHHRYINKFGQHIMVMNTTNSIRLKAKITISNFKGLLIKFIFTNVSLIYI